MARVVPLPALVAFLFAASVSPAAGGDAFLKAALFIHPWEGHLSDRWLLSFGNDYPLNLSETVFLGFEVQSALYRVPLVDQTGLCRIERQCMGIALSDDEVQVTRTERLLPVHGFVNAKFKTPTFGARAYAGAGVGMLTFLTFGGGDNWDRQPALQLQVGVEVGAAAVEFKTTRCLQTNSTFVHSLLFGFVW